MKSITEFPVFTLNKALVAKTALLAEGKTPEEIQANLGESFKLEGDKLNYLMHSLEVASTNSQNLKRVLIIKLNEGETAPLKSVMIEDLHFVPEFFQLTKPVEKSATSGKGDRGRSGGRGGKNSGGPKGSPWGLSPEEKAAKNKKPASN